MFEAFVDHIHSSDGARLGVLGPGVIFGAAVYQIASRAAFAFSFLLTNVEGYGDQKTRVGRDGVWACIS